MAKKDEKKADAKKAGKNKTASAKKGVFLVEPTEALSLTTNYGTIRKGRPKPVDEGSAEHRHYSGRSDVSLRLMVAPKKVDKADG